MNDKKTVHKWYWVWEFEKEERWLNAMSAMGWALEKVGFATYHFTKCQPGEYTIRLEMHDHDQEYLDFMAETGAEYIGRMAKWIFFRKKTALGEFDLFSDLDSRINHLKKIERLLWIVAAGNLLICLGNIDFLGWINLLCVSLLMYALGRIHGKLENLQDKRLLLE